MATTNQMYQTLIIEHDRSPRNYKRLDAPTHHAEGRNPLCGDEVSLDLTLDADGVITDVGFQGHGCAVSKASSSMMTTAIKGKTVPEALALFDQFHAMLTGQPGDRDALGKLVAFEGLAVYPMRVKCATMAWHVLKEALSPET
ncbi:MAG: SUF system NifU family Fe-S cluster assembly protein [Gemmatimonadales bacterium]|nr:SUF system NifU family Fe-S cluster assembly protein [Gemmatimonadales bacterium]